MQFLQRSWRNFIYGISHIYMYTAKSKNSIMLSHNNIYQDLQTIDNHVELIILRRWENFLKGAVKNNRKYPNLWPSPSFFFLSFDVMIGPLLFDQGRLSGYSWSRRSIGPANLYCILETIVFFCSIYSPCKLCRTTRSKLCVICAKIKNQTKRVYKIMSIKYWKCKSNPCKANKNGSNPPRSGYFINSQPSH